MSPHPMLPALPPVSPRPRRSFLRRGLINQVVCLAISVPFWLLSYRQSPYWVTLLYSMTIGNLIWLFIDGGRRLMTRLLGDRAAHKGEWPGWGSMGLTIVIGSLAGYQLGTTLVDALLGFQSPSIFKAVTPGVITLLVAVTTTYFFWTRERLHAEMAAAEAARRLALENQLKLLESQLEPHMLFNTLANLRILVATDPQRAQQMLDHLVAYLRATLGASRASTHSLAAEFERLNDYLTLMAIRMGPRLRYSFTLPEALRDLPVPGLLLQAVVENSIKHGLEPKVEGGDIRISAQADGPLLTLQVRDSGVGMPQDTPAPTPDSGFGLAQVRQRLHTTYGERASLALHSAPGGGTLATITLPLPVAPA